MPKRYPTPDPQIVRYADGMHYLRIGDKERSLRTKDFKEAAKRKPKLLALLDSTGERSGRLKVGDVWGSYVEYRSMSVESQDIVEIEASRSRRRRRTISLGTFAEIEKVWRLWLKPYWDHARLDKIDEEKWVDYTDRCDLVDMANPRKVFRGFLKWAKSKKYIKYIPDLPIPQVERRERCVLKPNDIRKLFQHAKGSTLLYISASLFMGMRRKEIMTLRWDCIHLGEGYLTLRKSEVKTRKGRPLPINSFVSTLLGQRRADQIKAKINTPYVFPHRDDPKRHGNLGGLKGAWTRVVEKCEFEKGYVTPHDLRATFEAYAHKAVEFTDTQREKFAGASIDVQKKTYVRFDAEDVRGLEAVVQVEGLDKILRTKISNMGKTRGESNFDKWH